VSAPVADTIRPEFHESGGFLWFANNGLKPYWFLSDLLLNKADGHHTVTIDSDEIPPAPDTDVPYHVELTYSRTGIAPRDHDPINSDALYEIDVSISGPGQQQAVFQIYPRFDGMKSPDGEPVTIPWLDGRDGIAVQFQPTVIGLDDLDSWLRSGVRAIAHDLGEGVNLDYFQSIHPESRITNVERYVRITREYQRKLVRQDGGSLYRIARLLGSTRGTEGSYVWDNADLVGQRHAVEIDSPGIGELLPGHSLGKRLKTYHPKHVREEETDDDPMSSPVVRVAYHKSLDQSRDGAVRWTDRDEIIRELDETLINLLSWSEIPTEPDTTAFVGDDHFSIESRGDDLPTISRRPDPTPEIEAEQEHVVLSVLDGLNDSARDTLEAVTDGGEPHHTEIQRRTGHSKSTIYRALDKLSGVIESDNGRFQFCSPKIREKISGVVEHIDGMIDSATRRVERLARVELKSRSSRALDRWLSEWGAEIDNWHDDDETTTIRFDTVFNYLSSNFPSLDEVLEEGYQAWIKSNRDPAEFDNMLIRAETAHRTTPAKVRGLRSGRLG
jgi:hypothetical protein